MSELSRRLCELIPDCRPRGVEGGGEEICRVAIACGSGGSLLSAGARAGCDLFLTGESTFHSCLEAQALGLSLLLIGHFASERFSMDHLAKILAEAHVDVQTWASRLEKDPIVILH
ncbi:MAG: Nif3-like dinuclear metal center hexameric protein [Pirellulaceae bacterium]